MRRTFALALAVLAAAVVQPAMAEQSQEDAYAACLIGNAVVEMHNGADRQEAGNRAFATCESYAAGLDENEAEGISDFMESVLDQLPESGG